MKSCFPDGVIEIKKRKNSVKVEVVDPWKCTMSRECLRHEELRDKVFIGKERQHYKFHIESVGVIKPQDLLMKAFGILNEKCEHYLKYFRSLK